MPKESRSRSRSGSRSRSHKRHKKKHSRPKAKKSKKQSKSRYKSKSRSPSISNGKSQSRSVSRSRSRSRSLSRNERSPFDFNDNSRGRSSSTKSHIKSLGDSANFKGDKDHLKASKSVNYSSEKTITDSRDKELSRHTKHYQKDRCLQDESIAKDAVETVDWNFDFRKCKYSLGKLFFSDKYFSKITERYIPVELN